MVKTVIVAVIVAAVILTECMFAYLLIPSRGELEKWSTEKAAKEAKAGHNAQDHKHEGKPESEVDLGKYNVIVHHPASNITLRVNFHLVGTVLHDEEKEFEELLTRTSMACDQAIFEIRNCQIDDLTDPDSAFLERTLWRKEQLPRQAAVAIRRVQRFVRRAVGPAKKNGQ